MRVSVRHSVENADRTSERASSLAVSQASAAPVTSAGSQADPLVSVLLRTYNHEPFIREAVAGILSQQVDFTYDILICEDCSTDRTREIVVEMARQYPDRIRLFLSATNQNDTDVYTRAWRVAKGRYIAYLDGDDYWTDRLKLHKQVRFLEENPDVFVCGHAVRQIDHAGRLLKESKFDICTDVHLSEEDMASGLGFPLPHLSVLFRNNGHIPDSKAFRKRGVQCDDTFTFAFFSNFGRGFISAEIMGVHRVHPGSVWASLGDEACADLRNTTLRAIPAVINPTLRSIAYYGLLQHSLHEDYRLSRKLRDIPLSLVMIVFWLRSRSAAYLAPRRVKDTLQATRRLFGWTRESRQVAHSWGSQDVSLDMRIKFSAMAMPAWVRHVTGLSGPEVWGRWSDATLAPSVRICAFRPFPDRYVLRLRLAVASHECNPVLVTVGARTYEVTATSEPADFVLDGESSSQADIIDIRPSMWRAPNEQGWSDDTRRLGVALHSLEIVSRQPDIATTA